MVPMKKGDVLAPLVATLRDGTVLHMDRAGRVLRSSGPSAERFLGGPGSGNFGHAGRPGQVGGSSSGGSSAIGTLEPTASNDDARKAIDQLGFRTTNVESMPPQLLVNWAKPESEGGGGVPRPVNTQDIDRDVIDGVSDGLSQIKDTELEPFIKRDAQFAFLDYKDSAQATTATDPSGSFVIINGNKDSMKDMFDPKLVRNTVAGRIMSEKGLTGDKAQREYYRHVVTHEVGHVVDHHTGALYSSGLLSDLFGMHGNDVRSMTNYLKNELSNYAASGPPEAFAELFAATAAGRTIKGLEHFQSEIKRTLLTKKP